MQSAPVADELFIPPTGQSRFTRAVGKYPGRIEYVKPVTRPPFENRPASKGIEWCFNFGAVPVEGEDSTEENFYLRHTTSYATGTGRTGTQATLAKWAPALGVDLSQGFNALECVGKMVDVVVVQNEAGYNRIDTLLPWGKKNPTFLEDSGPPWEREHDDDGMANGETNFPV